MGHFSSQHPFRFAKCHIKPDANSQASKNANKKIRAQTRCDQNTNNGTDRDVEFADEPGHQELCDAEQAYLLRAIEEDLDLTRHMNDAVASLAVCLAADESVRTGKVVEL